MLAVAVMLGLGILASPVFADNYMRQPHIDALHYQFGIELSDTTDTMHGEATVRIRFNADGVNRFWLDLTSYGPVQPGRGGGGRRGARGARGRGEGATTQQAEPTPTPTPQMRGMIVESVTMDARDVVYQHERDNLVIYLESAPEAGRAREFTIRYHGIAARGLRIGTNRHGDRSFFSLNWPILARQWLPMIDHPSDKATSEFIVTAPSIYQVVANGLLIEELDLGDGRRTTHWKQSAPISSWLNAIGVAEFYVHHAGDVRDIALQTWVAHQDREAGPIYFELPARQAIEFFSDYIGPYPYEKLANVTAAGLGGGTEHASAIFYGENIRPSPNHGLVAHEIAHQWFGNAVTESDWDDVWLSEGFATYFAHLYTEHYNGRDAYLAGIRRSMRTSLGNQTQPVIHEDIEETGRILNNLVYQKGACVLHMLRGLVGDESFQAGIRAYYARYRDKNASTDDLMAVMEEISGRDLDWFFDQWLRRPGAPTIEGTCSFADGTLTLDLTQTQTGEAFRLPMEVGITRAENAARFARIEMTQKTQRFTLAVDDAPTTVTLDPNTWLLMDATIERR